MLIGVHQVARSVGFICVAMLLVVSLGAQVQTQSQGRKYNRKTATARVGGDSRIGTSTSGTSSSDASVGASRFDSASAVNGRLMTELEWTFGGKQQRGWQIYFPLIASLIDSSAPASSTEFADRVARWQREQGLAEHGRLDSATFSRMVSTFQSNRIKDRSVPTEDQLVTIPVADCYDPTRAPELRRVERNTFAAYKRMVAAAAADHSLGLRASEGQLAPQESYLKIISAYRSREYQDLLRKQSPSSGRAALAVNSPHFTGRAIDLYVGGEPVSAKDANRALQTQTMAYRWLVKNAARFGFRPYFYEPWHWEYVGK